MDGRARAASASSLTREGTAIAPGLRISQVIDDRVFLHLRMSWWACRMTARSLALFTGFCRKALAPASITRFRLPRTSRPVTTMTGTR